MCNIANVTPDGMPWEQQVGQDYGGGCDGDGDGDGDGDSVGRDSFGDLLTDSDISEKQPQAAGTGKAAGAKKQQTKVRKGLFSNDGAGGNPTLAPDKRKNAAAPDKAKAGEVMASSDDDEPPVPKAKAAPTTEPSAAAKAAAAKAEADNFTWADDSARPNTAKPTPRGGDGGNALLRFSPGAKTRQAAALTRDQEPAQTLPSAEEPKPDDDSPDGDDSPDDNELRHVATQLVRAAVISCVTLSCTSPLAASRTSRLLACTSACPSGMCCANTRSSATPCSTILKAWRSACQQ